MNFIAIGISTITFSGRLMFPLNPHNYPTMQPWCEDRHWKAPCFYSEPRNRFYILRKLARLDEGDR